ncbi:hypothetical protein H257_00102 [Aphanomyces astaci]|uniref:PHD-type domain-containing protein n=1 Tax=Aphanomyces astaci TaxID=112090 RepID=W4HBP0_APHAT|nr:hypothetical protein H257_00102 [Aphanomyces astaci]ETV88533.1 hypothetical protein H257_00102 [Aphanomyces astaci]|eukprot:XP_009820933.1 hypothetical protein H257_00102 [Aphanomyces astaci]
MSAAVEYNWNVEYKKDKRLKEMKDACYQMLTRLKIAETSAKEASARPKKTVPVVPYNLDSSSSNTDSDGRNKSFSNPMDEMSEYENDGSDRGPRAASVTVDLSDRDEDNEDEDDSDTPCVVCKRNDNDMESMFCETCDDLYHTYCAGIYQVPEGPFYCPPCSKKTAAVLLQRFMAASPSDLNDMLVHVASCPSMEEPCVHPTHKDHCSFVKNLLRCAAMLSVQLQGTKVASQLALALGYHAAHCHGAHFCHVPHCNDANRRKHVHPGVQPLNLDEDEEGDD